MTSQSRQRRKRGNLALVASQASNASTPADEPCFVYVLGNFGKGSYRTYVGWTCDVERRLAQHNAGTGARSTRGRAWTLIHVESFATRRDAMSREWHLKRDRVFRKELARRANLLP
jgi:putative endonuclease